MTNSECEKFNSLFAHFRHQQPRLGASVFNAVSIDMMALRAFEAPQVKAGPVRQDLR
jgi:hypothetical protein